jgi:hypothetical protein
MEWHNRWIWNEALLDAFVGGELNTRHEMQGINLGG